ncbi:GRAM domain-containing protein 2B isoform X2 [Clupea harengus]|uniref:GRAM domain-containing protein 2B isoform X2 n=1 Tax=Clupea harengus TaxID=7950 RepID=A0A6P8G3J7_CLUHA|nr:GRAM domain-containing protein 2B isoform X2 [Clupea harengus]
MERVMATTPQTEGEEVTPGVKSHSYTVEGAPVPGGKVRKGKSLKKVEPRKALSLEESQLESLQPRSPKLLPIRSQTFDIDRSSERTDSIGSRSSFIKHNKTFHKIFHDIPETEDLIHAYICALQKEVPYHGRLYVTENHVCFHSSVLLKATKVVIPISCVNVLKKQNTALLVPNALSIRTTEGEKFLFVSLRNREACYKLLRSVCLQLEDGSTNSSPLFSSAENSFDQVKLPNSSQSSLEDSFDQLDRGDSTLLLDPPPTRLSRDPLTHASRSTLSSHREHDDSSSIEEYSGGSWVWSVTDRARSLLVQREPSSLNTLLFIYLFLVVLLLLSSGYIGLRIVALEEQLASLGALPEFTLQSGYKDT